MPYLRQMNPVFIASNIMKMLSLDFGSEMSKSPISRESHKTAYLSFNFLLYVNYTLLRIYALPRTDGSLPN